MASETRPLHVSLVAVPEAAMSTLVGIYDVLNAFGLLAKTDPAIPESPPFTVDIVGTAAGEIALASGLPLRVGRGIADIAATDIVLVPSVVLGPHGWQQGRYPELVDFAARMHRQGALLCSACSGIFLLAETGLFDGHHATVHWGYAGEFAKTYPRIRSEPERVLVASGTREDLITSGASTSWHDLVLYLIVRFVGAPAAQAAARFFALQWHQDGLAPYIVFEGRKDHGDATIAEAQTWLAGHFSVAAPVEEVVRRSGLAERTFKRRFTEMTGLSPIDYVQRLRVEDAKRRLERTEASVEEISWRVGYEDAAFFRRLFKRVTGLSPGVYRKRFRVPQFARAGEGGKAG
jgi:transcriptional regulator GlxA family with amidase domain